STTAFGSTSGAPHPRRPPRNLRRIRSWTPSRACCVTSGAAVDAAGQSAAGPERSLDLAGSIVKGRYRVNAIASVSRDVVVYTAEDIRYRRPIALKLLRDEFATDPAFVNAVRDQASTLAMLSHAHRGVARVYECDAMDDGRLFVAVERTNGSALREVLD